MDDCGGKWVIIMLMGEYRHNLDEKGRLIIPSKIREELGNNIIITKGFENCLVIYSEKEWVKEVSKLKSLPFTKKDARSFTRIFLSGATNEEFDKQGRIKIASPLIEYAGLTKECIIIGVNDKLEIWSKEKWDSFMNTATDNLSDLADHLFETNFEG